MAGKGASFIAGLRDKLAPPKKEEENKEEDEKEAVGPTDTSVLPTFAAPGATGAGGGLGTGVSKVAAGAPKVFNIQIENLKGIETLATNNLKEATSELEQGLLNVLLNVLNDSQKLAT